MTNGKSIEIILDTIERERELNKALLKSVKALSCQVPCDLCEFSSPAIDENKPCKKCPAIPQRHINSIIESQKEVNEE